MNLESFLNLITNQFDLKDINKIKQQLQTYNSYLLQENSKYNLTNLLKDNHIWQTYFYESIINFKKDLFNKENMKVLDIGTGSGIPGVILKILFPFIDLYLIEANQKKCLFLNNLIKLLDLQNVTIINQRCESYIKNKLNYFDLITCRGVAKLNILLELSLPGLKIKGVAFFLKSINYMQEIKASELILKKLNNFQTPVIEKINYNNKTFVSLTYVKYNSINHIYPREWKKIIKNDQD